MSRTVSICESVGIPYNDFYAGMVHEIKAEGAEDERLWRDTETRLLIIQGGIHQAKELGCAALRVLDTNGSQLYLGKLQSRLRDLTLFAHEGIDDFVKMVKSEARVIHELVQEACDAFERGDVKASHAAIKEAMDREHAMFGECEHTGADALLEELGYDIDQEEI